MANEIEGIEMLKEPIITSNKLGRLFLFFHTGKTDFYLYFELIS